MARVELAPRDILLAMIDEAFGRKSWHGTNLRGSLRGMSDQELLWRPAPGGHNTREIALQAAYWKYTVKRRLCGEKRGSFPLKGNNWFPRAPESGESWRSDLAILEEIHAQLRKVIGELPPGRLQRKVPGSSLTIDFLIRGAAAHDLYHAGQIQLLKRLMRINRTAPP